MFHATLGTEIFDLFTSTLTAQMGRGKINNWVPGISERKFERNLNLSGGPCPFLRILKKVSSRCVCVGRVSTVLDRIRVENSIEHSPQKSEPVCFVYSVIHPVTAKDVFSQLFEGKSTKTSRSGWLFLRVF